jgi:transposase
MHYATINGIDQGFSSGSRRPWRHGGGQSTVRRSRSVQISSRDSGVIFPSASGGLKIVHQRFGRWAKNGVFERIFKMLASDHDNEYMMIDATIVRSPAQPGARKTASSDWPVPRRTDHQDHVLVDAPAIRSR